VTGVVLILAILALALPSATAQSPTQSPTPTSEPTGSESASPTGSPTGEASPTDAASPSPTGSPSAAPEAAAPDVTTDTEYLKVRIDDQGRPEAAWLKDWIRLRGSGNRTVVDPGTFANVSFLKGTPGARQTDLGLTWDVGIGGGGYTDLYYEGRLQQAGDYFVTPAGLKPLPINVRISYFTGEEGSESPATALELEGADKATSFKIAITLTNMTRQEQEVSYNDIQTGKTVTAVAPVWTPYVARVVDLRFPDGSFDKIKSDGDLTRDGSETVVNWTKFLVPPDFPAEQTAVVSGVIAKGAKLPEFKIVSQPVFPPLDAEALTSKGIQFERGRRNFFYDVFGLFRENLVALTGLFGLLHDSFANLSIPLLGPEKGNRERGSFDKPNQLWALWTLTKGIEQLDRAFNVFQSTSELLRDALKGSLATLTQLRAFVGYSTDESLVPPPSSGDVAAALLGSIWTDLKTIANVCGDVDWSLDSRPYFPEAPLMSCPAAPQLATSLNLIFLKLALVEHDLHSVQKENHTIDTGLLAGLAGTPWATGNPVCSTAGGKDNPGGQQCKSYNKYTFIKFPFGLEEIERGLYTLKTQGFEPLQAAIGNPDMPNSIIFALHTLTEGTEAQIDAFHQLGATWRYIADSIQNFAIFGIETARNILQWDINGIDIDTAVKAASVARAKEMATFMGMPAGAEVKSVLGQVVLTFGSNIGPERSHATDSVAGKLSVVLALAMLLVVLGIYARFKWFII
jgi:hypothetical protein